MRGNGKTKIKLHHNIRSLSELETNLFDKYNDKQITKEVALYRKSLTFFIKQRAYSRALYESECLIDLLIYYLED